MTEVDDVTSNRVVPEMGNRIRERERALGSKTLEAEMLRLAQGAKKTDLARAVATERRFSAKAVAETLGVARANLIERLQGKAKLRQRCHKAHDAALEPLITTLVAARPALGYRRIAAILNRRLRSQGLARYTHMRTCRVMKARNVPLARKDCERPEHRPMTATSS